LSSAKLFTEGGEPGPTHSYTIGFGSGAEGGGVDWMRMQAVMRKQTIAISIGMVATSFHRFFLIYLPRAQDCNCGVYMDQAYGFFLGEWSEKRRYV
jgi:hypothetical protein